jgi:hypothetical protein
VGEAADESRALAISEAVDGGTYECRFLVEHFDVVTLTSYPIIMFRWDYGGAIQRCVPFEDIVLELGPI